MSPDQTAPYVCHIARLPKKHKQMRSRLQKSLLAGEVLNSSACEMNKVQYSFL